MWSEVIDGPKVFYPDGATGAHARPASAAAGMTPVPARPAPVETMLKAPPPDPTTADLLRDIRRSKIRQRFWIGLAAAQVAYLVVATFWPGLL